MRVKAVIAYDGSAYLGFQKQKSTHRTIMSAIEKALFSLHIHSPIVGSGRTDAGVHASGQVIHFDLPPYWHDLPKLTLNLNRQLYDIQVKYMSQVSPSFHARFSAKRRLYRYIFKTSTPSVFEQKYVSYYPPFDTKILQEALIYFKGKHDFAYFRKTGSQTYTTRKEMYMVRYKQRGDYHIIYFQANGFLRAQVRMMIDSAMQCATHRLTLEALKAQLLCQHKHSTTLAPAEGLYLAKILYDTENL
ncbi:MAG: tRNA pseudouridine(38-40) synthase TruA [Sulfurovum sp.]|nr:tRNA pseudouridine(38-40) synthase TruA [Sulfurovum sp.]